MSSLASVHLKISHVFEADRMYSKCINVSIYNNNDQILCLSIYKIILYKACGKILNNYFCWSDIEHLSFSEFSAVECVVWWTYYYYIWFFEINLFRAAIISIHCPSIYSNYCYDIIFPAFDTYKWLRRR